jgi:hypothetical protein
MSDSPKPANNKLKTYETYEPSFRPEGDQTQEATTTPPEDPFAAEDKFEPHRGYYGYSVKTFKNPSIQEIIEWNLLSPPWVHEDRSITARKNRFKRLRLVKRKIDERN